MRIMSPPKFIMSISLIMRLIITLIVFQCTHQSALSLKEPKWSISVWSLSGGSARRGERAPNLACALSCVRPRGRAA